LFAIACALAHPDYRDAHDDRDVGHHDVENMKSGNFSNGIAIFTAKQIEFLIEV
jgi:hypothetical protein